MRAKSGFLMANITFSSQVSFKNLPILPLDETHGLFLSVYQSFKAGFLPKSLPCLFLPAFLFFVAAASVTTCISLPTFSRRSEYKLEEPFFLKVRRCQLPTSSGAIGLGRSRSAYFTCWRLFPSDEISKVKRRRRRRSRD